MDMKSQENQLENPQERQEDIVKLATAIDKKDIVRRNPIQARDDGQLIGKSLEEQYRLAQYYVKSGFLSKGYDTPEKALIGFQYAIEMGLKPLTAMKNICVINGQPNLWGELPLSLVRKSGLLEKISEYFIDNNYKEICLKNKNLHADKWAAVCVVKRRGDEERDFSWTDADVKQSQKGAVWAKYPQIMWKRKVRSIALKDVFGDVLGTFDIAEYNHDQSPDVPSTMVDVVEKKVQQAESVAQIADEACESIVMIKPPSLTEQAIAIDVAAIKLAESIGDDESLSSVENSEDKSEKTVEKPVDKPKEKAVEKPVGNPID